MLILCGVRGVRGLAKLALKSPRMIGSRVGCLFRAVVMSLRFSVGLSLGEM